MLIVDDGDLGEQNKQLYILPYSIAGGTYKGTGRAMPKHSHSSKPDGPQYLLHRLCFILLERILRDIGKAMSRHGYSSFKSNDPQ